MPRIGFHPSEVWQLVQAMLSGPCGLLVCADTCAWPAGTPSDIRIRLIRMVESNLPTLLSPIQLLSRHPIRTRRKVTTVVRARVAIRYLNELQLFSSHEEDSGGHVSNTLR